MSARADRLRSLELSDLLGPKLKGKPAVKRGRKASGLGHRESPEDSGVAGNDGVVKSVEPAAHFSPRPRFAARAIPLEGRYGTVGERWTDTGLCAARGCCTLHFTCWLRSASRAAEARIRRTTAVLIRRQSQHRSVALLRSPSPPARHLRRTIRPWSMSHRAPQSGSVSSTTISPTRPMPTATR